MREPELLKDILQAVREVLTVPLTVKIRAGWDDGSKNFVDVAHLAQRCGVAAIAMHPRTRVAEYSGKADWSLIARLKREMDIPVIGSGDVKVPQDAIRMLEGTGCDGVMIGRTAISNPWILKQCWDLKTTGRYEIPDNKLTYRVLCGLLETITREVPPAVALGKVKNLVGRFSKGSGLAEFREAIFEAQEVAQVRGILSDFLVSDCDRAA
jgi:tRNA-dihydrouridine synthase